MKPGDVNQKGDSQKTSRFTELDHLALTEEANNLGHDLLIDHQPTVDKPSDPGPHQSKKK
ncbi:hypothetical protein [Heliorestis convoluta]|uniref:Uncharacterized protein n=1 Tax=Heliorestis convoluta TaxID=356322 RepID=A0A5Q2N696_9FIRM|nr:hypothetical protein [Heliorestis convoluta]QGG49389.1 hypothetical protein FTV88_3324 [Heliorestis convoluta]